MFEEKAQLLAYDDNTNPKKSAPTPSLKRASDDSLPNPLLQMPKKSPSDPPRHPSSTLFHPPPPKISSTAYHPAPNICVEGGRIEFIKSPSEGSNLASLNPQRGAFDKKTKQAALTQFTVVSQVKPDVALTRAQQTQAEFADFEFADEKCDVAKVRWQ